MKTIKKVSLIVGLTIVTLQVLAEADTLKAAAISYKAEAMATRME